MSTDTSTNEIATANLNSASVLSSNLFKEAILAKKKPEVIEKNLKINKELFMDTIHKLATFYYGEDFVETRTENHLIFQTIYFPEITVKSSAGFSVIINDIFFKITIDYKKYKLVNRGSVLKTTYTYEQATAGYIQSHVSNYGMGAWSTGICFGSNTPIELIFLVLYDVEIDMNRYDMFLGLIQSWISYESIEGGPHVKMSTIPNRSEVHKTFNVLKTENQLTINAVDDYIYDLLNQPLKLRQTKHFEEYIIEVDPDFIEDYFIRVDKKFLIDYIPDKDLYCINTNSSMSDRDKKYLEKNLHDQSIKNFHFKGVHYLPKLVESTQDIVKHKRLHPGVLTQITNKLNSIIIQINENARIKFIK